MEQLITFFLSYLLAPLLLIVLLLVMGEHQEPEEAAEHQVCTALHPSCRFAF